MPAGTPAPTRSPMPSESGKPEPYLGTAALSQAIGVGTLYGCQGRVKWDIAGTAGPFADRVYPDRCSRQALSPRREGPCDGRRDADLLL